MSAARKPTSRKAPKTSKAPPKLRKGPRPVAKAKAPIPAPAPPRTHKTNKPRFKVENIAEALKATGGIYVAAANVLGCAPNTIKNYVLRHKELQELLHEISEQTIDVAESQLLNAIRDGNMQAVIFYLKTKGKNRGYSERTEVSGPDGGPLTLDLSKVDDEELERLARAGEPRPTRRG